MTRLTAIVIVTQVLRIHAPAEPAPLFQELPPEAGGVKFLHPFVEEHPRAYLYHSGFGVGGICLGDVNGDGQLDIYLVSGPGENRLFIRNQKSGYRDAGVSPWSKEDTWGTGASLVDLDNDGDLDLYQCNYDAPNQLFVNNGQGAFTEVAGAAGLAVHDASLAASFADVDNDGDLDMFLLCNRYYSPKGRPAAPPFEMKAGIPVVTPEYSRYFKISPKPSGGYLIDDYGRADYLFLNQGLDGQGLPRFKDVSRQSGLRVDGYGLSSIWWDFDGDGDQDLYVANDFADADRLFRNDGTNGNGIPRFENVVADHFPHITWSSMGSDVADINQDGLPDLMSLDMSATTHFKAKLNMGEMSGVLREVLEFGWPRQAMRNHLFLNTASDFFQETAFISGLYSSDWSWTIKFGDLDNDGFQDVFISNGMARNFTDSDRNLAMGDKNSAQIGRTLWELHKEGPPMPEANLVFQNLDGRQFRKRSDWGLGLIGMSYSAAMGDLDNDGDLDLVVSDLGKNVRIYQNQGSGGNSLKVKLTGTGSNRMGIGARVVVTDTEGRTRTRWMNPWTGFLSQNDTSLHFGLGTGSGKKIAVYWPSGLYQERPLDDGTREISITEGGMAQAPATLPVSPRFVPAQAPRFTHMERIFDDFKRQPLLPGKLSQLGPCLAKGDVDGDGDEDFFVGGATEQQGALFINNRGTFAASPQAALGGLAAKAEDSAALWFDADGDKDLDLLVVTGSTEYEPDDVLYHDRLYLNETGQGGVTLKASPEGAFPQLKDSGSCAVAADSDGDGDLDLFIGSRSIPGKYPLVPESRLLRNDTSNGVVNFTEVTPAFLKTCGMVTDACWADLDADGDPDLCLSTDWGGIKIFHNDKGALTDVSIGAGTRALQGWWNTLHAVDVDQDGDLDLVAGNAGLNTKYKKPSHEKPAMIYYGDMDGSGISRIVEAKSQKDKDLCLPVRGRSCTTHAMPLVSERFKTYRAFASASLDDIYGDHMANAYRVSANHLESGIWINETKPGGAIAFRWQSLPWDAQLSPVNAIASGDFNGDGRIELILAQNHFTSQAETGLWRGNPGCHLEWQDGRFNVIRHLESGIILPNDTKAILAIDADGDGKPDILAGQNDDKLLLFTNAAQIRN